ncbi:hypothetical protein AbraIFM66950_008280 [Aspergillus brasiliensis]|nr:hypothetical protein AbraIFM66950_008280 [Aspergillus brasiliensis]
MPVAKSHHVTIFVACAPEQRFYFFIRMLVGSEAAAQKDRQEGDDNTEIITRLERLNARSHKLERA